VWKKTRPDVHHRLFVRDPSVRDRGAGRKMSAAAERRRDDPSMARKIGTFLAFLTCVMYVCGGVAYLMRMPQDVEMQMGPQYWRMISAEMATLREKQNMTQQQVLINHAEIQAHLQMYNETIQVQQQTQLFRAGGSPMLPTDDFSTRVHEERLDHAGSEPVASVPLPSKPLVATRDKGGSYVGRVCSTITKPDFLVVTGASSNHFLPLQKFLDDWSMHSRSEPDYSNVLLVVYDFGLSEKQRRVLDVPYRCNMLWREFPFSQYPSYFNISQSAGQYAWKAVAVRRLHQEWNCSFLWLDSGDAMTSSTLHHLRTRIKNQGFTSSQTDGTVQNWVHPATLSFLVKGPQARQNLMVRPLCYCQSDCSLSFSAVLFVNVAERKNV